MTYLQGKKICILLSEDGPGLICSFRMLSNQKQILTATGSSRRQGCSHLRIKRTIARSLMFRCTWERPRCSRTAARFKVKSCKLFVLMRPSFHIDMGGASNSSLGHLPAMRNSSLLHGPETELCSRTAGSEANVNVDCRRRSRLPSCADLSSRNPRPRVQPVRRCFPSLLAFPECIYLFTQDRPPISRMSDILSHVTLGVTI